MYTLSSIVVVIFVVFLWIFRRFSLVAFAGCTAHVHCFHETATALATGHGTTEFSRLSPLSVNRTHSLSLSLSCLSHLLSILCCLSCSVNDRTSDPYKILNNVPIYTYIYRERHYIRPDTSHIFVKNTYDKRQHCQWESKILAKGCRGLASGAWHNLFCFSLRNIFLRFFLFWKNP